MDFKCEKCEKEFKLKQSYQRHLNKKIPCNRIIKCDNCNKIFKTLYILNNHLNRKNKCIKVDLEKEIVELKHKNEILELKLENAILKNNSVVNNTTNNNTFILNNFGNENLEFITKKFLTNSLKNIMNNTLPLNITNGTQLKAKDLNYYGADIKDIDIFRLFIKLIFKNNDYPENETIKYEDETDEFYYYSDNEWYIVDKESKNILIERITKKIQTLLLDKKPFKDNEDLKKLQLYLGEEYDIKKNKINEKDYGILYNSPFYNKLYSKVLSIEYKDPYILDKHFDNIV